MKKFTAIIIVLFVTSRLFAQLNAGININYCYPISKTPSRLGYNALIGYLINGKLDIDLKMENAVVIGSLIEKDLKMNSLQLELKYYLVGLDALINPYISIGSGYFIKTVGESREIVIGVLPSFGSLVKIRESKKRLYLNARISYCFLNTTYPTTTLNYNIGLLYYFNKASKINNRQSSREQ